MDLIIPGLSVAVLLSIVFALHRIVQEQLTNLKSRLEQEAQRLKEATDKAELALQAETSKAEARLVRELTLADERHAGALSASETKLQISVSALKDTTALQFDELRRKLEKVCGRRKSEEHL